MNEPSGVVWIAHVSRVMPAWAFSASNPGFRAPAISRAWPRATSSLPWRIGNMPMNSPISVLLPRGRWPLSPAAWARRNEPCGGGAHDLDCSRWQGGS
jgi:hypothetical protein